MQNRRAGEAVAVGRPAGREALQQLLEATKEIDRAFLARVDAFPVRVVIRYDEIAQVRMERIERLLEAAYRILDAWRGKADFEPPCGRHTRTGNSNSSCVTCCGYVRGKRRH